VGRLIVIEGLDGSGKATLAGRLTDRWRGEGLTVATMAFPRYGIDIHADLVRDAFARATSPGRLEIIRRSPMILLDAAHNPHGAETVAVALEEEEVRPVGGLALAVPALHGGRRGVVGHERTLAPEHLDALVVAVNSVARVVDAAQGAARETQQDGGGIDVTGRADRRATPQ